jgi:hypothetical protein
LVDYGFSVPPHPGSGCRLQQLKKELEVKKAAFDGERTGWEAANNVTIEELKRMSLESLDGKKKSKVWRFLLRSIHYLLYSRAH